MKEIIPLLQTALWIGLILFLIKRLLPDMSLLQQILSKRLESGSSVKVGPVEIGELKNEVNSVKVQLGEIDKKVANLFLTTMAPNMYFNLKKFHSGQFGKYTKTKGLTRELYHLRDIGYIEIKSITNIPSEGENLSEHVIITSTGAQFVELREKIEKERDGA
jgi:hypothetical protein